MGLFEKALGLAGVATGGIALATKLLGGKKEKLAKLDTEFAETKANYELEKKKLEAKIKKGNRRAEKQLQELEHEYYIDKAEYENKRKTLLPEKSKIEVERETKEFEQRLEIEKATAMHKIDVEKAQTIYGLELEKDKNYHQWDIEDAKTSHTLEMDKEKNRHEWDMEKTQHLHDIEMEKMQLSAKLGFSPNTAEKNKQNSAIGVCPSCRTINDSSAKFCGQCGTALFRNKFCTNCGSAINNSKFCSMCGQAVEN